ncbi:glycoside hydrolase family 2 TIM barrel-domain containing protein [Winogradskyella jejuensis]|uniref:Glycosyl hydrolases family 2, TIM barrel domain n=1 Tax=Winogradskyella jejuensis TaxID=1089305 RepID=A0A1M5LM36_9FLAO|nr:glycoside hydrolase family 2 TIM barrel-domain containing protein [Winogradskyella jejuensis]SHG66164.1 Glycosyl hydrolases family 2, TIM barrel domain [Winogradskyella jejuensis]
MKKIIFGLTIILTVSFAFAQQGKIYISSDESGKKLVVNGKDFIVNGINWDYVPIGNGILDKGIWNQSDDIIKSALDSEMALFKNMGVNAIRTYGLEPRWITYIYENYGIYTMLNTQFGAYGLTINGAWVPQTDYTDPETRKVLMKEVTDMANKYKNTPGLLLYMIGNENNYHLSWTGAETEAIPIDGVDPGIRLAAEGLYKAFNDAAIEIKGIDNSVPVAICNGDLLYLDIVKEYCKDIDIYGTNMYRGISFSDAFQRVKDELDKPILFAEFGADAFNTRDNKEDQYSQAYYNIGNWKEIYENAAGLGKVGNSIGGFTFQSSDGWWKWNQTKDFDVHNNNAVWPNGGYSRDQAKEGDFNMNEEWFGICAKGPTNERGLYELYPRAVYYALKEAHRINPYEEGVDLAFIDNYFKNINLMDAVLKARGDKAALDSQDGGKLRISQLSARFSTFSTGGNLITTPDTPDPTSNTFPNQLGFDHMQSYFIGVEGNPSSNMRANVNFNIVGNVAQNPIDEIFYENRARPITVEGANGEEIILNDNNRVQVYNAEFEWNAKDFDLRGFYRTGHYHWGYEGDFFGLYPEANYGPNLDIYGGEILGAEIDGKGAFKGLKAAIGPQLWWGANPTMLFKYSKNYKGYDITGIYHRDFETDIIIDPDTGQRVLDANQVRSGIIPAFPTERATIAVEKDFGKFNVMVGGIWAGSPLNGLTFQDVRGTSGNYIVYNDKVQSTDNWGGKFKVMYQGGRFNWYSQGSYMGLVANGGADQTQTFTGWRLRDSGSGNQVNLLSGFTYTMGDFQVAPNFMFQKPLVAPMPNDVQAPGRLRNVIDDPFAVRNGNRETYGYEMLITYDPTPGTWMYEWNNDRAEDAKFAANLGFTYRRLPTTTDAHIGFLANRQFFAFPQSAPAEDLWEINSRMVSKLNSDFGVIGNFYYGNGQANGDSDRLIKRFGGDIRAIYKKNMLQAHVKVNDWGPFDYHRDFNLTFPLQLMVDLSTSLGKPDWFILPSTRIGIRGTWRSLNEFSPRFGPNFVAPNTFPPVPPISPVGFDNGQEWEIRTYVHINIGK